MRLKLVTILAATAVMFLTASTPAWAIQAANVAVSVVEPAQAVLVVKTDVISDMTVDFGSSPGTYTATRTSNGLVRHEVTLDGLTPSGVVYYRVTVTESGNPANTATLAENSFRTTRPAGEAFSYAVGGDDRPDTDTVVQPLVWGTIVGQMASEGLDLVLTVGDIIYGLPGDSLERAAAKYDGFFAVTSQITGGVPLYPAVGNHERIAYAGSRSAFEREFTLPANNGAEAGTYGEEYYSFDNGDTHFISLCTELPGQEGLITGNQKTWLENDLAATDRTWIVVFMHRPLFSGLHPGDPWTNPLDPVGQQNKADIHSLLQQYGVDVVFQGHEHFYLHHQEDGIQYLITGGGGAPLHSPPPLAAGDIFSVAAFEHVKVDETRNTLQLTAIDQSGQTLEAFTIWALDINLVLDNVYWGSYTGYILRDLSVDYTLANDDAADISNIQVTGLDASGGVASITGTPFSVADLAAGQSTVITVDYMVSPGITSFSTFTYISCEDLDGNAYEFPGPYPG